MRYTSGFDTTEGIVRNLIMKKPALLTLLGLYLASAALSFGAFNYLGSGATPLKNAGQNANQEEETLLTKLLEIDPNAAKDQVCPLNGAYYTKAERDAWEKRRPLAVMIENAPDARPQSGLSAADVVFEAVAEGGVTRFMGIYYCAAQHYEIEVAPVRSARTYFIDWASGFNEPLYAHVGGANLPGPADALGQLSDYGWVGENDLNQFSIGYPTFVRDYNRLGGKEIATEHTMVSSTELLWAVGEEREWTNTSPVRKWGRTTIGGDDWQDDFTPWEFEDGTSADGSVGEISYDFWTGYDQYAVRWVYNPEANTYARFMAGDEHIDLNTEKQIHAANVIVLLTTEKGPIDEVKHMLYGTTGTGDALIFKNGEAIEATWSKRSRTDELSFVDSSGDDIPLARGLTWISVVGLTTEVEY